MDDKSLQAHLDNKLYAGYPASAYLIDPKVCKNCIYANKVITSGLCNYLIIKGHSRPKKNSTRTYCEAKETKSKKE